MPYKTVLWGMGADFGRYLNLVRYMEERGEIDVVCATANDSWYKKLYGYLFVPKNEIHYVEYSLIIAMSSKGFLEMKEEIQSMGIDVPVISCEVLSIPDIRVDKYIAIMKNPPTIFASNCWGGMLYHRLKLPFSSPLINMFVMDEDYIRLLEDPRKYMDMSLVFEKTEYDDDLKKEYPLVRCGDILLHFNHYNSFQEAVEIWDKRKKRINWNHILAMMWTNDRRCAEAFCNLPYEKKVCFTSFEMDDENSCSVLYGKGTIPLYDIVNWSIDGRYHLIDIIDIMFGKIKKVIE